MKIILKVSLAFVCLISAHSANAASLINSSSNAALYGSCSGIVQYVRGGNTADRLGIDTMSNEYNLTVNSVGPIRNKFFMSGTNLTHYNDAERASNSAAGRANQQQVKSDFLKCAEFQSKLSR